MRGFSVAPIRMATLAAVALGSCAVLLARLQPTAAEPPPTAPRPGPAPGLELIQGHLAGDGLPRLLDLRTGRLGPMPLPEGDRLFQAACSPWRDDRGDCQVVGGWARADDSGFSRNSGDYGLARYALPGGRALDRIRCEVLPTGPACWAPDRPALALFPAAGDGLYRIDFADPGPWPERLEWSARRPPGASVLLGDLTWPTAPGLGSTLLASLIQLDVDRPGGGRSRTAIWWLRLDRHAGRVVDAGPLVLADWTTTPGAAPELRHPRVAVGPGGGLLLAYLRHRPGRPGWQLCLDPIEPDRRSGGLRPDGDTGRVLAEGCLPIPPAFTPDGRGVYSFRRPAPRELQVVRHPTAPPRVAADAQGTGSPAETSEVSSRRSMAPRRRGQVVAPQGAAVPGGDDGHAPLQGDRRRQAEATVGDHQAGDVPGRQDRGVVHGDRAGDDPGASPRVLED